MRQVGIIRGLCLRKLKELKILITCLPETEHDAIAALSGVEGQKTAARITDYILKELGHTPPAETPKQSPTMRQAGHQFGNGKRA